MQVSACNLRSMGVPMPTQKSSILSRREICISSACSPSPDEAVSPQSTSIPRIVEDETTQDFGAVMRKIAVSPTRRVLMASLTMYSCFHSSRYLAGSALALGDPSVTLEEVTPPVFSSGPLFPTEDRIVQLFERNTYSVVNIFDVTLRPQLNVTGVVEIPEGNGSGVVWDDEGHIVTNYHVIGNALSRNPSPGEVVARVNILASEGVQKNFEGILVGADRLKDLAVLKVEAPKDILRPIEVGQSSFLKVGQQCLAIGNPFGFDHTLTVGVISGLNRDIFSQTGVTIGGGIQTDAAINPGNSGGLFFEYIHSFILLCSSVLLSFKPLTMSSETVVLKVAMSCGGCSGAVTRVLQKMEGVESFDIDMKAQKVTVKGNVKAEDVFETVSKTGKKTAFWVEPENKPSETVAATTEPAENKPLETASVEPAVNKPSENATIAEPEKKHEETVTVVSAEPEIKS